MASYTLQVDTAGSSDQLTANLALNGRARTGGSNLRRQQYLQRGFDHANRRSVPLFEFDHLWHPGDVNGKPAGRGYRSVSFYTMEPRSGSGTVSSGVATFASSTLTAGSYSITAAYSGDSNYKPEHIQRIAAHH